MPEDILCQYKICNQSTGIFQYQTFSQNKYQPEGIYASTKYATRRDIPVHDI
jgi:hypothetical protein